MAAVAGEQVAVMFLLMAVGFLLHRTKVLSDATAAQLNRLLLLAVTPMVLVSSFNRAFDAPLFKDLGLCFVMCAVWTALSVALAYLLVRGKQEQAKIERFSMCFSNCGFMGIPLIEAALGSEAVVFAAVGVAVFNLSVWTFGRIILVGGEGAKKTLRNLVLNPGILAVTAGFLIFVSPWTLPAPLGKAADYIGRMNTPLAMIVIGTFLSKMKLKDTFKNLRTYRVMSVRNLLVPALMIPLYMLIELPKDVALASYLLAACPVAAISAMFPAMFNMDTDAASGYVSASTLASIATIPLMVYVFGVFVS